MLPPQKMTPTRLPASRSRSFGQRGDAHRAGALDEIVRQRDDRPQALGDLGVRHGDEAGESRLQRRKGEIVGRARRDAFGEGVGARRGQTLLRVPGIVDRRRAGGLHAVDLERRRELARHRHRADGLRAAADRDDERVERRAPARGSRASSSPRRR